MANVGSAYVSIYPSMNGFSSKVSAGLKSAFKSAEASANASGSSSGKSFSSGFALKLGVISSLASTAFNAVGNVISSSMSGAISRVDTLNQFPKIMQSIGFSAEDAEVAIQKLSDGIIGLPTSLDDIVSSTKQIALLTGDLDLATDTALALNDAFYASGASSADASRGLTQYTQMLSKGTVDMQSWRTLQETMGYALRETANAMGFVGDTAVNDLYNALQSGEVTFDEFNNALIECDQEAGGFAETAGAASEGIQTSMDNLQLAVERNLGKVIDAFNATGIINDVCSNLSSVIDGVGDALVPLAGIASDAISNFVDTVVGLFSPAIQAFQDSLQPIIENLGGPFLSAISTLGTNLSDMGSTLFPVISSALEEVAPHFSDFIGAVIEVGTAITNFLNTIMPYVTQFLEFIIPIIAEIIASVIDIVTTIVEVGANIFDFLSGVVEFIVGIPEMIAGFCEWWENLWLTIGQAIQTAIDTIIQWVTNMATTISEGWTTFWQGVSDFAMQIWEAICTFIQTAIQTISDVITTILQTIQTIWDTVWGAIKSFASSVWNAIKSFVQTAISTISSVITSTLNTINSIWTSVWNAVKSFFQSVWNGLKSAAQTGVNAVYNVVTTIKDKIVNFFSGAGSWLINAGKSILQGLADGITSAIGTVTSTVSNAVSSIRNLLPFSPAKEGPFSGHGYTTYSGIALMGDFAKSIAEQTGVVKSAVADVMSEAQLAFDADVVANPPVFSAAAPDTRSEADLLNDMLDKLDELARLGFVINLDGRQIARGIAQESDTISGQRQSWAARGLAV